MVLLHPPSELDQLSVSQSQDVRLMSDRRAAQKQTLAPPLTHVVCDDGERPQVGLPDVLGQSVGVVLKVAEKMGCATIRFLDLLPVLLVAGIQY